MTTMDSEWTSESPCHLETENNRFVLNSKEEFTDQGATDLLKNNQCADEDSQSGEEEINIPSKKRPQFFSDSEVESDTAPANDEIASVRPEEFSGTIATETNQGSSKDNSDNVQSLTLKTRLRKVSTSDDGSSNTDNNTSSSQTESRIKNKRRNLRHKFKSLLFKKNKKVTQEGNQHEERDSDCSSNDEAVSIGNLKQKIKERTEQLKSTLYDPDTSDEESVEEKEVNEQKNRKKCKPTSPKPVRMSAKQAIENMQKIKSESNRMLREKEVSLPYHRPKALSLKDIMSKKRAAFSADGKALPIKMNEEQLKHYVELLEQRQKEVIELCKSESEEEVMENIEADISKLSDTLYDDISKIDENANSTVDLIGPIDNISTIDGDNMDVSEDLKINSNDISKKDADQTGTGPYEVTSKESSVFLNENVDQSQIHVIKQNILDKNESTEMELVYNDSVEENGVSYKQDEVDINKADNNNAKPNSEVDSQLISLHYDSERAENNLQIINETRTELDINISEQVENINQVQIRSEVQNNEFSDNDDIDMEDIDAMIENAEISASQNTISNVISPKIIKEPIPLTGKPKLTGTPGMIIDLDGTDPVVTRKLTGVELLKERFVYFSKLKTPEELEREKERRIKPGLQHLKLKQELEEQIAEQRSLEWTKRLEESKALIGDDTTSVDIDRIEAELEEKEELVEKESTSESELEEQEEIEIVDKPRKRNPMIDDEAEESECEEECGEGDKVNEAGDNKSDEENNADDEGNESEEETSEESEDSEDEQSKPKKGRILKAFEDSDDDNSLLDNNKLKTDIPTTVQEDNGNSESVSSKFQAQNTQRSPPDDELHLAQKSISEDLFTSQESHVFSESKSNVPNRDDNSFGEKEMATQTFSISENAHTDFPMPDTLSIPCDTQSYNDNIDDAGNLDAVVGMCSGSFSQTQNLVTTSEYSAEVPDSQAIGADLLALCTGQFYDNQFVSQENIEISKDNATTTNNCSKPENALTDKCKISDIGNDSKLAKLDNSCESLSKINKNIEKETEDPNLKSILDELHDPEFDIPKTNKFFKGKENKQIIANAQYKKFIIESDDEDKDEESSDKKKKNIKKKKLEQRALKISDDEEEDEEEYVSELDEEQEKERVVDYDSEENEVVAQLPKKKRKAGEFFEQEAELTSEDEWAGSGDEDERGLDRMEREEGDDDTFNQGQLQRELGQIHMRDVLDQDKREVRLIQELLFEDGDLGGGSRQRKFRWRNADGEEETETTYDDITDTKEEEFESEEQWRKQRHERAMFLKSLEEQQKPEDSPNVSFSRTTMIKANLSKNSSDLFADVSMTIEPVQTLVVEKKTAAKDIPSPKKPFAIFQQNYHNSLLTRGRGALARLAALATPLVADDDAPRAGPLAPSSNRNFVFAAVEPPATTHAEPKVLKRKAESNPSTPKLLKKMKTEEMKTLAKPSLLDHLKV